MKYLLLTFIFCYTFLAHCQNSSIGLYVSPELTLPMDYRLDVKTRLGYSCGIAVTKKISKKHLWINTGIGISHRGYSFTLQYVYTTARWSYSATDIELPLLLQYRIRGDKKLIGFVSLGAIFGFKVKEGADSASHSYRYNNKNYSNPERINLRLGMGLGYKIKNNLQIMAEPFIMQDVIALQRDNWKYAFFSNTYSWGMRVTMNYLFKKNNQTSSDL